MSAEQLREESEKAENDLLHASVDHKVEKLKKFIDEDEKVVRAAKEGLGHINFFSSFKEKNCEVTTNILKILGNEYNGVKLVKDEDRCNLLLKWQKSEEGRGKELNDIFENEK